MLRSVSQCFRPRRTLSLSLSLSARVLRRSPFSKVRKLGGGFYLVRDGTPAGPRGSNVSPGCLFKKAARRIQYETVPRGPSLLRSTCLGTALVITIQIRLPWPASPANKAILMPAREFPGLAIRRDKTRGNRSAEPAICTCCSQRRGVSADKTCERRVDRDGARPFRGSFRRTELTVCAVGSRLAIVELDRRYFAFRRASKCDVLFIEVVSCSSWFS